ncbi:hypothetical protein D3C87_2047830 [compost metagenome]
MAEGGAKAATEETIIIFPLPLSSIPGINIFDNAITETPSTLINFSSSSIGVSWNGVFIPYPALLTKISI